MPPSQESNVTSNFCPESTVESANRRDFMRKAALVTAAVGVGSVAASSAWVPKAEAKSAGVSSFCNPVFIIDKCKCSSGEVLCVLLPLTKSGPQGPCGCYPNWAIHGATCTTGFCCEAFFGLPPPSCGPIGVLATTVTGTGILGYTCHGTAVKGLAAGKLTIPMVAQGAPCQIVPLQEWLPSSGAFSSMDSKARLALGNISTGGFELLVCAPNQDGVNIRGPLTGEGAALQFNTVCPASGKGQGWQIMDTGCRASQGPARLNIRNLTTSKDVVTMLGSNVGINGITPLTTLHVGGSVSAKVAFPSTATYCMASTCFAVLSASATTINLPAAGTATGMLVFIKRTAASTVTINAAAGDTIEGKASKSLTTQYDSVLLMSNGGHEWFFVGNSIGGAFAF
jgi:hypothetical protein